MTTGIIIAITIVVAVVITLLIAVPITCRVAVANKVKKDAVQENISELKDKIVAITNDFKAESEKHITEFRKIEESLQSEIHNLELAKENIISKTKIELDSETQKQNSDNSLINSKYDGIIKRLDENKQDLESSIEYEMQTEIS